MKAHQERMMALMKASLVEIKSVAKCQEVPKEEAIVQTIGVLEDP
jgi:hypothetical protein